MAKRKYPRIGFVAQMRRVPLCVICGDVATWQVSVQTTFTRGDDEIVHLCNRHQKASIERIQEGLRTARPRYAKALGPKEMAAQGLELDDAEADS